MVADATLEDRAFWSLVPAAVCTPLGDGAVILDLRSKRYFLLNGSGREVWLRLKEGRATVAELVESVCSEYEVDPTTAERDVQAVLSELLREDLIHAG